MFCLSIQFDIFLVRNIDNDLHLSKVLYESSTVYASYWGSKDDLKSELFLNIDLVFGPKGTAICILMLILIFLR